MAYQLTYNLSNILTAAQINDIDGGTTTFKANKGWVFDPTPLITMEDTWERQPNEDKIRRKVTMTLKGTLLSVDDSTEDANGLSNAPNLENIYLKKKLLVNAFAYDRGELTLETVGGDVIFTHKPVINSISFEEGVWVNRIDFTIALEAESDYTDQRISSGSESIDVTFNAENDTLEVNRTISATGMVYRYGSDPDEKIEAVDNARVWVLSKIDGSDIDDVTNTTTLNTFLAKYRNTTLSGSALWNTAHIPDTIFPDAEYSTTVANSFSESRDDYAGTYQIQLNYVKCKVKAIVEVNYDTNKDSKDQKTVITINGTVVGLGIDGATKYTNAVIEYNKLIGASNLEGGTISIPVDNFQTPKDLSKYNTSSGNTGWTLPSNLTNASLTNWSRGIDEKRGTITFSFTFDDSYKIYNNKYAVDQFDITRLNPARKIAIIDIPYRQAGAVVQDLKTKNIKEMSLNITGTVLKIDINGNTVEFNPTEAMFNDILLSVIEGGLFSSSYQNQLKADLITNVSNANNLSSILSTTTLTDDTHGFDPIRRTFSINRTYKYNG
jgi:hypothetical protein